jgi:Protein of unknown function (DUF3431)
MLIRLNTTRLVPLFLVALPIMVILYYSISPDPAVSLQQMQSLGQKALDAVPKSFEEAKQTFHRPLIESWTNKDEGPHSTSGRKKNTDPKPAPTTPLIMPVKNFTMPFYFPGTAKKDGEKYRQILVMGASEGQDIDWVKRDLPEIETAVYIMDNEDAPLHVPKNVGGDAMVYLTYIIDNYEKLPEIVLFFHSDEKVSRPHSLVSPLMTE